VIPLPFVLQASKIVQIHNITKKACENLCTESVQFLTPAKKTAEREKKQTATLETLSLVPMCSEHTPGFLNFKLYPSKTVSDVFYDLKNRLKSVNYFQFLQFFIIFNSFNSLFAILAILNLRVF
jgi:hypothetical protein